jgi:HK97 family phage prohead protease
VYTATISTGGLDRDNEILEPAGMVNRDPDGGSPVLWGHDPDRPIGRTIEPVKVTPKGIVARYRLASRPPGHVGEWLPDTAAHLIAEGVLTGVSVGFNPLEAPRKPTPQERAKYGPSVRRVFPKWELLEFSVVAVPSNPEALITTVGQRHGAYAAKSLRGAMIQPAAGSVRRSAPKPKRREPTWATLIYRPSATPSHRPGIGTEYIVHLPGGGLKTMDPIEYQKFRVYELMEL